MRIADMRWPSHLRAIEDRSLEDRLFSNAREDIVLKGVRQLMGLALTVSMVALALAVLGLLQL
jgi:hypothetical protein